MNAKDHYDNHLGHFYSWMAGDFQVKQSEFKAFLDHHHIKPFNSHVALDLGAGHGIQSTALALAGFRVKAVDFNQQLLRELRTNAGDLAIEVIEDDIRSVKKLAHLHPDVIVCWGDTLTHLDTLDSIAQLIRDAGESLAPGGKLLLSFRDYSQPLTGTARFIPVKSDGHRILTCILEYDPHHVTVTDLLYFREGDAWKQKAGSYKKVRIPRHYIQRQLVDLGLKIEWDNLQQGLVTIIAANDIA